MTFISALLGVTLVLHETVELLNPQKRNRVCIKEFRWAPMDQSQGPIASSGTELRIRPVWSCNRPDSMSVVVLIACLLYQRVCYNVQQLNVSCGYTRGVQYCVVVLA